MNFDQLTTAFFLTFFAGLSTILGSLFFIFKIFQKKSSLIFFLGFSAGVMIYLSFAELVPTSINKIGFFYTNFLFFLGILIMAFFDYFFPHHYLIKKINKQNINNINIKPELFSKALMMTVAFTIHNIPEGMVVFLSSLDQIKLGILLAIAVAIHNIPEGMAVAVSVYQATKNKIEAIKYTAISALAEPLGAIIFFLFFRNYFAEQFIFTFYAVVAGIMIYVSFDELLPSCFQNGVRHYSILGIIFGMLVVFISLAIV